MQWAEAYKLMNAGKKVRCVGWHPTSYYQMCGGVLRNNFGQLIETLDLKMIRNSTEWEEYHDEPIEVEVVKKYKFIEVWCPYCQKFLDIEDLDSSICIDENKRLSMLCRKHRGVLAVLEEKG